MQLRTLPAFLVGPLDDVVVPPDAAHRTPMPLDPYAPVLIQECETEIEAIGVLQRAGLTAEIIRIEES